MSQDKKQTLENSNLKSIKKITNKKKKTNVEDNLRALVEEKDAEISRLNRKITTLTKVDKIKINDEEMIAIMQLQRLKGVAQTRELTLEESRKFEIFSKIKNSVNKTSSIEADHFKLPVSLDSNDLLKIASGKKVDK